MRKIAAAKTALDGQNKTGILQPQSTMDPWPLSIGKAGRFRSESVAVFVGIRRQAWARFASSSLCVTLPPLMACGVWARKLA
jgi:hypothetical protein